MLGANAVNVMEQTRSLYHIFCLPSSYTSTYDFLSPFKGSFSQLGVLVEVIFMPV